MQASDRRPAQAGFTLIELLIAVAIAAGLMLTVHMTFMATMQAGVEMEALSEDKEPGPRILALIERDLAGLWHFNIKKNRILRGRNLDVAGSPADRIDFLTTTDSTSTVLDGMGNPRRPTLCEVGYWLRQNPDNPQLMELWRREDPMIDDNLITEGQFQLVHDRLKSFNIKYYATLGHECEELHEWDSSVEDTLPRRILIEFTLERRLANRNRVSGTEVAEGGPVERAYTRHVVLDPRYPEILKAGVAMVPLRPRRPAAAGGGAAGPGGAAGSGAGAARGGAGAAGPIDVTQGGVRSEEGGRNGGRGGNRGGGRGGATGGVPPVGGNRGSGNFDLGDLLRGAGGNGGGGGLGGLLGGGGRGGR